MNGANCKTLAPAGRASKGAFDGAHIALLQLSIDRKISVAFRSAKVANTLLSRSERQH